MMEGIRSLAAVKENNCRLILQLLRERPHLSKAELARLTGLSHTTIGHLVRDLRQKGYVRVAGMGASSGGRRPEILEFDATRAYVAGVDIQVDETLLVLVDLRHHVRLEKRFPALEGSGQGAAPAASATSAAPEAPPAQGALAALALEQALRRTLAEAGVPAERLGGLALSIPGVVDSGQGRVVFAPNLGWRDVPLRRLLSGLQVPVLLENEANAAAVAEHMLGREGDTDSLVYVSVRVGLGCGIVLNGRLYRGVSEGAGEFGHMTIAENGPLCRCGNRGCWEVMADNAATVRRYLQLRGAGQQHPGRAGRPPVSFQQVVAAALAGTDPAAVQALQEAGRYLGMGVANVINALNPQRVVIGGPGVQAEAILGPAMETELRRRALEHSRQAAQVVFSRLGPFVSALGAAAMMVERLVQEISAACAGS